MDTHHSHNMVEGEHSPKELFKFGLVIAAITAAASILHAILGPYSLMGWMRWFMGVFFVVFAGFKFAGYEMFVEMFPTYDVVAKRIPVYAKLYPLIELALGVLYLLNAIPVIRDVATLVVMAVSSLGIAEELRRRRGIHCACLGNIIKLPLSTVSLVENVSMGLMALVMLMIA